MTARDVMDRVEGALGRSDLDGWDLSYEGSWTEYGLGLGSGWEMVVRVDDGRVEDGFGLYHGGEVRAILGMDSIEFREDAAIVSGGDRDARIPITPTVPEGNGIPGLTDWARGRLIDLVMGGCYRDIDREETLTLDGDGCLTMVMTCDGRPYSLPQVICRITCKNPNGKHPEFDFVGRLDMDGGKVSVRHGDQSITFDIPMDEVDARLQEHPPRIPTLREWLKDRELERTDPALSSMREGMGNALRRTGFEPGTVVYLRGDRMRYGSIHDFPELEGLLPCPVCGFDPVVMAPSGSRDVWFIGCRGHGSIIADTFMDAVDGWNDPVNRERSRRLAGPFPPMGPPFLPCPVCGSAEPQWGKEGLVWRCSCGDHHSAEGDSYPNMVWAWNHSIDTGRDQRWPS